MARPLDLIRHGAAIGTLGLLLAVSGCDSGSDNDKPDPALTGDAPARAWPEMPEGETPRIDMKKALTANYYLVLDGSGSMMEVECSNGQLKMDVAVQAVQRFVAQIPEEANIGLAVFDSEGLSERVPLAADNRAQLRQALAAVDADQSTPLRSAITLAYQQIEKQAASQLGYGEYHLVVVTDGQAQPDDEDPRAIVDTVLRESPVVIHTVGFCIGNEHALNQPGRTFYAAAESPEDLQQGLSAVLAEAPSFDATTFQN